MIEILVKVLGFAMVSQALRERESAKIYTAQNPIPVKQACKTLSDYWLNGNPSEYLESLDIDLRNCLICHLATDISNEILVDMGLIQV
jgi:hypothetical protein